MLIVVTVAMVIVVIAVVYVNGVVVYMNFRQVYITYVITCTITLQHKLFVIRANKILYPVPYIAICYSI